jgi:hypothetical protein
VSISLCSSNVGECDVGARDIEAFEVVAPVVNGVRGRWRLSSLLANGHVQSAVPSGVRQFASLSGLP